MDQTAKQQVVERLKGANNVLVTVSANPSVDQLAGAIGMTLMINTMGKHATAVFSGQIPDTMQFLDPAKTLEVNVDSLRDFIIALDKNKADKLRYKVEDDVVKIFITPYRTHISEADLQFSQGDYNVDVVIALGVRDKNDLDRMIIEHGRILHDAAVISVNTGHEGGSLGAINWVDDQASSLCEMLMSISEALQSGLVDEQVATALLTGIVSETARFSNEKTTPKVMTMSAQLMAAGANQQLIASHLHPTITNASVVDENEAPKPPKDPSEIAVKHDDAPAAPEADMRPVSAPAEPASEPMTPSRQVMTNKEGSLPNSLPPGPIADMIHDTKAFSQARSDDEVEKPALGGTFSATATEAHEASLRAKEAGINNTILNHGAESASNEPGPEVSPKRVEVEPETPPDTSPMVPLEPEKPDESEKPAEEATGSEAEGPATVAAEPPMVPIEPPASPSDSAPADPTEAPMLPDLPTPDGTSGDFDAPLASLTTEQPGPHIPLSIPTPAGELNPAAEAQQLDGQTLDSIDASARTEPAADMNPIDLDSARTAVEAAMSDADIDGSKKQAIGINGRLDIHPGDVASPGDMPPPTPPMFDTPPPPGGIDLPPPFENLSPGNSPFPESPSSPAGAEEPSIQPHAGGYVGPSQGGAPNEPASTTAAAPAPDDFTLPPIT